MVSEVIYTTPLQRHSDWSAETFLREPFSHYKGATDLATLRHWPSPAELNEILQPHLRDINSQREQKLRFVESPPKPSRRPKGPRYYKDFYEPRIHMTGEIPTRAKHWHDLFNALVWASFPFTKARLNAIHVSLFCQANPEPINRLANRSREQDRLTLFDEGGVLRLLHSDNKLESLYFGHGALECLFYGRTGMTHMVIEHIDEKKNGIPTIADVLASDPQFAEKFVL